MNNSFRDWLDASNKRMHNHAFIIRNNISQS